MKRLVFIICLLGACTVQAQEPASSTVEQQLEDYTESVEDAESSDDTWLQQIEYYKTNPLDLNRAGEDDLKNLQLLTALQIENFLHYRRLLGRLISIYELQAIPAWDVETIRKLRLHVTVTDAALPPQWIKNSLKKGTYSVIARYGSNIERPKGYDPRDSGTSFYTGDRSRMLLRLKYQYKNQLQYGFTAAKDAGERFFSLKNQAGFDFYSFHLFSRQPGLIKTIALGDYTINLGQGLICWQGLAFGKGAGLINIKRQSAVLRPYNSAGSFYFNRGAAVTLQKSNWEGTLFASMRQLDANLEKDTASGEVVTSIHMSGYHRTPSELEDKAALQLVSYGGNMRYQSGKWQIGFNMLHLHFSKYVQKKYTPANLYAINGNYWGNYSVNYHYTYKNIHLFGETAMDKNRRMGAVHGMLAGLHTKMDFVLLHRYISKAYQAFYGNAFTANTNPANERGLYAGISFKPAYFLKLDTYVDVFRFPWLKYRVDAPAEGREYFIQLTYKPGRFTEIYTRYRNQYKPINYNNEAGALNEVTTFNHRSWRTQINHRLSPAFSIRQRFELLWYIPEKAENEKGVLVFFDLFYKPVQKPFSFNIRLQYFESDSYNSRLYAYENDVLYYYAIPVFYDTGTRYCINVNCTINKQLSLWLKWGQTIYSNRASIGSGLDEIQGNRKSEIRILLSARF
ncbi:MAG: hypothetical protein KF746_10595 [Chitinophagaceae bacterium]|nr:hypothetical protein [Chitinophagaceae bacterium]